MKKDDITLYGDTFPNYSSTHFDNGEEIDKGMFLRIINKIFSFNYNKTKLSFYETDKVKISKNDIVFDCGASTGIFSLYASYKAKLVYSFEKNKKMKSYLKNTKSYNPSKIHIMLMGLDKELTEGNITMDQFVKDTKIIPDFIKINVEGDELNVIEGAARTIKKYAPKMVISIHIKGIDNQKSRIQEIKDRFENIYNFELKEDENFDPLLVCQPKQ